MKRSKKQAQKLELRRKAWNAAKAEAAKSSATQAGSFGKAPGSRNWRKS